jgi:hypothetical protein
VDVLEIETVSQDAADLMKPQKEESGKIQTAIHVGGPGSEVLILGESERDRTARRIQKINLELGGLK